MTKCPHGDAACGVYYDCGRCLRKKREAIWNRLTPEQRSYDNHVDPLGAYTSGLSTSASPYYERDEPAGCSCHINPPCSYCCDDARAEA